MTDTGSPELTDVLADAVGAPTRDAPQSDAATETARRGTNLIGETFPPVDFYALDDLLTAEERALRDKVRAFVDRDVVPIMGAYWERAEFPLELLPKINALGIVGGPIRGYGCPGLSPVANGLALTELARGDASVSTFLGVHSELAMGAIALCGSEEQKQRWLPVMARMEKIGAFALTEPWVGSDAAHIQTTARRKGDAYVITGAKRWIGLGDTADVIVVWARDEENGGKVAGFVVERGTPGFTATPMTGKVALRALGNADLTFENVRVPVAHRLGNSHDFRDTARVLAVTRYGVACQALGVAIACYQAALAYTAKRQQFGKPLAGYQLVQRKLAWMLTEITQMQLVCWRLGTLLGQGRMTPEQAALAKLNNAQKARQIAADARDLLGGNGILLDNIVARQQADIEALFSYEGADHIQTLVLGRAITGLPAFA